MLALALAMLAVAAPDQRAALERAEVRWGRQHIGDYTYRLEVGCFCPPEVRGPSTITVRRGRPVRPQEGTATRDTVPELFDVVETALDEHAARLSVRYDRRRGFPRSISVDGSTDTADDEITITVDRFRRHRQR